MRKSSFVLAVLVALPAVAAAQRLPRAPRGRTTRPEPAQLPPQAPAVTRALAYRQSRWSAEAYSLVSMTSAPNIAGVTTQYNTLGLGSHGEFRFADRWSSSVDLTTSLFGGPATTRTVEVGSRYAPLNWSHRVRPFVDLRAAYIHLADSYATPDNPSGGIAGPNQQLTEIGRYSRGWGGVGGVGFEVGLTRSFSLTNEVTLLRSQMHAYRLTGPGPLPNGASYWATSARYALGIRFNPVRALSLAQNPRQ